MATKIQWRASQCEMTDEETEHELILSLDHPSFKIEVGGGDYIDGDGYPASDWENITLDKAAVKELMFACQLWIEHYAT